MSACAQIIKQLNFQVKTGGSQVEITLIASRKKDKQYVCAEGVRPSRNLNSGESHRWTCFFVLQDYGKMNDAYRSYFRVDPPARTEIAVSKLGHDSHVEITLVASH